MASGGTDIGQGDGDAGVAAGGWRGLHAARRVPRAASHSLRVPFFNPQLMTVLM